MRGWRGKAGGKAAVRGRQGQGGGKAAVRGFTPACEDLRAYQRPQVAGPHLLEYRVPLTLRNQRDDT